MFSAGRAVWAVRAASRAALVVGRGGLVVVTGYLDVLTVAALVGHWTRQRRASFVVATRRFAVLIPAHNEERLLSATLDSLANQDYPEGLRRVHVVADNCTDGTVAVATEAGVSVHERVDPERPGKGPALQWLIARLDAAHEAVDAYVFIDADTTAEPGFLSAVDRALSSGSPVVQGHYAVRDAADSNVVAFRAAAMAVRNFLRPLGRSTIGGSAGLYGNGMAFRADAMRSRSWSDHLTEDVELHLDLLLDGTLVAFASGAVVTAEMPDTLEASQSQHERWERGRIQLASRYVPRLVRRAVQGGPAGRIAYADAALDQAVPPLSVVVAGTTGWIGIAAFRTLLTLGRRRAGLVVPGVLAAGQAATVLTALRLVKAPRSVYRSLFGAPRMVVWKVGLWARAIVRPGSARWIRTARN